MAPSAMSRRSHGSAPSLAIAFSAVCALLHQPLDFLSAGGQRPQVSRPLVARELATRRGQRVQLSARGGAEDLSKLTNDVLRQMCRDAGLQIGGNKADLVARLEAAREVAEEEDEEEVEEEVEEEEEEEVEEENDEEVVQEDLSKLTNAELQRRLKEAGLPTGGKKADLIARLESAVTDEEEEDEVEEEEEQQPSRAQPSRGGQQGALQVGDKVRAMSPDDEQWYPGRIDGQRDSGVWVVAWDDPDGGPETNDLSESNIKKMHFFQDYKVGDDCRAMSPDDENMYPGTVAKILKDGKFLVKWDDPDGGDETSEVHFENMKKVRVKRDYKKGDEVLAMYPDDGDYYEATVVKKNKDGSFQVHWSDPDGGPENSAVDAKEMKIPPITFDELELGQKYQGIISRTDERGFAFVDINAHRHGFLHISRVSNDYVVGSIDEHLEEDQEVTVWISGISDDDSGHFEVSMVEGIMRPPFRSRRSTRDADLTLFADVSQDKWFEGEVARVQPYGAFVEIELESGECAQGLVHVSRMSGDFVSDVTDYVQEGQTVQVRISNVDLERNKMGLTMLEGDGGGAPYGRREPDDLSAFADLDDSQILDGEVKAIIEPIALVRVKSPDGSASATGSVHITQMSESFVESIEDFVQVGQEVQVRVLDVDMDANRMRLTMMPYEEYEE